MSDFLHEWLKDAKIDRVGCFQYEPVQGAPANDIAGAVPPEVKEERWHRFMQTQQKVSAKILKSQGRQDACRSSSTSRARPSPPAARNTTRPRSTASSMWPRRRPLKPGEIVNVKIESSDEYDLHGTAV